MTRLLARKAPQPWTARFCCTLVLAWPDGHDEVFEGTVDGWIVWPMRGASGHGYDPIFQPLGYDITFGEMDPAEKNRISHRADAFGSWSRAALAEDWQAGGFGLYLHWPFCQAKCPYCDFNSHVAREIDHRRWRDAYLREIDRYAACCPVGC